MQIRLKLSQLELGISRAWQYFAPLTLMQSEDYFFFGYVLYRVSQIRCSTSNNFLPKMIVIVLELCIVSFVKIAVILLGYINYEVDCDVTFLHVGHSTISLGLTNFSKQFRQNVHRQGSCLG